MLCVVSGQHRYSRKIFNGKTFAVSKNLQKFSPLNDLTYTVTGMQLSNTLTFLLQIS